MALEAHNAAIVAPDDELTTTQWAAVVALLLLLLVPLAVALATWFKRRYARAVVQLQTSVANAALGTPASATEQTPPIAPNARPLAVTVLAAETILAGTPAQDPTRPARQLRWRVLVVQLLSGLLYWWCLLLAIGIALTYLSQVTGQQNDGMEPLAAAGLQLLLWPLLVLPPALAWAFQAGVRESRVWTAAGISMVLFGAGLAMSGIDWLASGAFALVCALLAFMLAAFMRPAVRGAGPPLVAAFTVGLLVFCGLVAMVILFDTSIENDPVTTSD